MLITTFKKQRLTIQLSILFISGLLAISILAGRVLTREKAFHIHQLTTNATISRINSLINILNRTPTNSHLEIIKVSNSANLHISLDSTPFLNKNEINDPYLKITTRFKNLKIKQLRLSTASFVKNSKLKIYKNKPIDSSDEKIELNKLVLSGSILLKSNRWLNFSSAIAPNLNNWSINGILLLVSIMGLICLLTIYLIKKFLQPLKELTLAVNSLGENKTFTPLTTKVNPEFKPLVQAYNRMQLSLKKYLNRRSQLLAAISHDLRTPITSLRLRCEFLDDSLDKKELLKTIERMDKMLSATMDFSKQQITIEPLQNTDITSFIETICNEYFDKGYLITTKLNLSSPNWQIPPVSFRRIIENIINNSIQYAGDNDAKINLELHLNKKLELTIYDNGPGVPKKELSSILEPFVRLDKARNLNQNNIGLGLSITKSLLESYGGHITLTNRQPHGLSVKITLH